MFYIIWSICKGDEWKFAQRLRPFSSCKKFTRRLYCTHMFVPQFLNRHAASDEKEYAAFDIYKLIAQRPSNVPIWLILINYAENFLLFYFWLAGIETKKELLSNYVKNYLTESYDYISTSMNQRRYYATHNSSKFFLSIES